MFWALIWASVFLSASVVYFDDGARVLAASHPLIALFFAMGVSSPALVSTETGSRWRLPEYGSGGLLLAALLFVSVPWIAHRFSPVKELVGDDLRQKQDEAFVLGGRRMSGFLVIEDNLPLRNDVPTLHLADFEAIVRQSGVEIYQGLLHPVMPPLPFGFVFAPRLERDYPSYHQYIVPPEVFERHNVAAWHFELKQWQKKPTGFPYWFYVTKAEPLR